MRLAQPKTQVRLLKGEQLMLGNCHVYAAALFEIMSHEHLLARTLGLNSQFMSVPFGLSENDTAKSQCVGQFC
jgi:hypothetical protein